MQLSIVKLGGSLLAAGLVKPWLAAVEAARAAIVVVPGGGPFADTVRQAQGTLGFGDFAADRMAVLAMEQMGHACLDLSPGLAPLASWSQIKACIGARRSGVWLPAAMHLSAGLPASWEVTSDSLAGWLALRLGADRLVFAKAAPVGIDRGPMERWRERGLVDAHLPALLRDFRGEAFCVGGDAAGQARTILEGRAFLRHSA